MTPLLLLSYILWTPPQPTTSRPAVSPPSNRVNSDRHALTDSLRLIREKKYDDARRKLEPLTERHPRWARAVFLLALTYHEEQRYERALPYFVRALDLDPNEHAIRPFLGWCLYYLGDADNSAAQFKKYLEIKPNYSDAHFAIGLIEFEMDHLDEAARRFRTTLELAVAQKDPRTEGKAHARLGDLHIRRNELIPARDELLEAVRLRPDAYEAYFKLSRVYQRLGDVERADWARSMHKTLLEKMHPSQSPMGGPPSSACPAASQPAGKAP